MTSTQSLCIGRKQNKRKSFSLAKSELVRNNWFQSQFRASRKRLQLTNLDNNIDAFAHVLYASRNAKRYDNCCG